MLTKLTFTSSTFSILIPQRRWTPLTLWWSLFQKLQLHVHSQPSLAEQNPSVGNCEFVAVALELQSETISPTKHPYRTSIQ